MSALKKSKPHLLAPVETHVLGAPFGSQVSSHLKDSRLGSIVSDPVVVTVDNGS